MAQTGGQLRSTTPLLGSTTRVCAWQLMMASATGLTSAEANGLWRNAEVVGGFRNDHFTIIAARDPLDSSTVHHLVGQHTFQGPQTWHNDASRNFLFPIINNKDDIHTSVHTRPFLSAYTGMRLYFGTADNEQHRIAPLEFAGYASDQKIYLSMASVSTDNQGKLLASVLGEFNPVTAEEAHYILQSAAICMYAKGIVSESAEEDLHQSLIYRALLLSTNFQSTPLTLLQSSGMKKKPPITAGGVAAGLCNLAKHFENMNEPMLAANTYLWAGRYFDVSGLDALTFNAFYKSSQLYQGRCSWGDALAAINRPITATAF